MLCMDDHQLTTEDFNNTREVEPICAQIVLACLHVARIGGPGLLWVVNMLARSVTKWNNARAQHIGTIDTSHQPHETSQTVLSC